MGKFTYDDVARYSFQFEDVSEPLKEYNVGYDGSLCETSSSCSLLGVKKNGKWGWIDTAGRFIIPPMYDSGFVLCFNGVIILDKNGCQGGLYRSSLSQAFQFKYKRVSHAWKDTYVAWNNNGRCALVKPGDRLLTSFIYKGFSQYNRGKITEFVKGGFLGDSSGNIDLETGREL